MDSGQMSYLPPWISLQGVKAGPEPGTDGELLNFTKVG